MVERPKKLASLFARVVVCAVFWHNLSFRGMLLCRGSAGVGGMSSSPFFLIAFMTGKGRTTQRKGKTDGWMVEGFLWQTSCPIANAVLLPLGSCGRIFPSSDFSQPSAFIE